MDPDLPWRTEYAKSGRSSCKSCKSSIAKDELRMAAMVQSPMFDGKVPNWYHFRCFFSKFKVSTEADISHFEALRWEDQEKIRSKISNGSQAAPAASSKTPSKGTKRKSSSNEIQDFSTEYAKSNRSSCKGCEETIVKDQVRISKLDRQSEKARRFGPHPAWYHVDCFVQARETLEFFEDGSKIPGFKTLGVEDQNAIKEKIKKIEVTPLKKIKKEEVPKEDLGEKKILKEQSQLIYKHRDALEKNLKKKEMVELLEYNDQKIPTGNSKILDRLSDIMTFGALEPCAECDGGQFVFSNDGYHCTGNASEWSKCTNVTKLPGRKPFQIPEDLKEEYPFLNSYKYKKRDRYFPANAPTPSTPKNLPSTSGIKRKPQPLDNAKIVLVGNLQSSKDALKKTIARLGGNVVSQIDKTTACIISTKEDVEKNIKKIREAKEYNVHVVSEDFLSAVENGGLVLMIQQYSIASWGGNPEDRINSYAAEKRLKSAAVGKSDSTFSSGKSTKVKLTVKGSVAVEPDSNLEATTHVLENKEGVFNAVLGKVDITQGSNSFYKLQLLESDKGNNYWVFRSWGRVGTTIGGNKTEQFATKYEAVAEFKRLYEEKTGTPWELRHTASKVPNKMYPLDIDYGAENGTLEKLVVGSGSKLPNSIQELICLIFDVEKMKKAMLEFEIDLKKMPLGKLSRKQIEQAYSVLTELLALLENEDVKNKKAHLIACTNRFFTLIPHDFGTEVPPLLDNVEIIKSKVEMLDFLLEVEIGYKLASVKEESGTTKDPIDQHYEQLKTKFEVLDKESEEFKTLVTYVKNTHAETHRSYELEVDEVFKIARQGERKRYRPFQKLHNRKLLWHGSRTTNMAGILSQGLRIAPPEAPVTGYMFGKGVYFADMVSKSANYCYASRDNNTGLLLLCEVALGNMHELPHAKHIEKLPLNTHSTKGIGQTFPDPEKSIVKNDVEIPLGPPVKAKINSSLLYNEFIVYDVAQINIQYLLKMKFNFKF